MELPRYPVTPPPSGTNGTDPQLVVVARRTLLDEGAVVGGDVSVVGVLLQHVDFQLDLLLFVLSERRRGTRH